MSRRKQTNPNKVLWEQVFAGLEEHARQAMMKNEFPGHIGKKDNAMAPLEDPDLSSSDSEADGDTTIDETSSPTSEEDMAVLAVKKEAEMTATHEGIEDHKVTENLNPNLIGGLYVCPLCQLDCGNRELLVAHVYQHSSNITTPKSYVCPECGRGLSSPGSLGRHLLIHSEDQLSNCAVCGARFSNHSTFNRIFCSECSQYLRAGVPSLASDTAQQETLCKKLFGTVSSSAEYHWTMLITNWHRRCLWCFGVDHAIDDCEACKAMKLKTLQELRSEKLPEVLTPQTWAPNTTDVSRNSDSQDMNFSAVYPAGILLVCNNCVAYRKLIEEQMPSMHKWAVRRQNESVDVRLQRLERERTAKKSRRDSETAEEREVRRMRDREAKRLQRMQETDEQRARRLQRDREAMRQKRANETPEKRQARLIREREAKRLKRRLEKMDIMLRAQFGQDPSAMAALAAEMNFFQIPVSNSELDNQLLGKMTFEEQSSDTLN